MSFRIASLSLVALLSVSFVFAGCAGVDTGDQAMKGEPTPTPEGDDDDDDGATNPTPNPTPNPTAEPTPPVGSGNEVEPNDDHDLANALGTDTTFSGACGDLDFSDIFKLNVPAGATVSASVTWTESADDDLDLYVSSYDYGIDEGDEKVPPADSPAQISAVFPTAQTAYVEVYCFYALNPDTAFSGTITVQ